MTLATYPLFRLAVSIVPALNGSVAALYRDADATSVRAMAWVSVLVLAEELLWRGALLEALENRMAEPLAFALSVLTYALAQLGSGSWIVFALAIVCGTVWTFARRFTGSLVTSTVSSGPSASSSSFRSRSRGGAVHARRVLPSSAHADAQIARQSRRPFGCNARSLRRRATAKSTNALTRPDACLPSVCTTCTGISAAS
jgi:hypothetical protein